MASSKNAVLQTYVENISQVQQDAPSLLPGTTNVMFTYEVQWEASDIRWASRWDTYLTMGDVQIHWFSIINSVVVVFFLAGKLVHHVFHV